MSGHDFIAVGSSLTTDFFMHFKVRDTADVQGAAKVSLWGSKIWKFMIFTDCAIKSWPKGVRKCSWVFWKGLRLLSSKMMFKIKISKKTWIWGLISACRHWGSQNLGFVTDFKFFCRVTVEYRGQFPHQMLWTLLDAFFELSRRCRCDLVLKIRKNRF